MTMFGRRLAQIMMMTASATALAVAAAPAMAQSEVKQFDIPAQALSSAILEFSRQSDVLIVVAPELAAGKRSQSVKGQLPVNEAIAQLLRGSRLRAVPNPSGGYRIDARVADGNASPQAGESGAAVGAAGSSTSDEIVVTGTNIRGQAPVGSPLTVVTREDIAKSGYGRLEDYMETLTSNFSGSESEDSTGNFNVNNNLASGQAVDLRGLGAGATLVLVNGRRPAAGGLSGAFVDTSSIPVGAIERIEILTDGASALYGSDAIGGVVNYILRKDYEGLETNLRLATIDGGIDELQASVIAGKKWSTGHILASYQYSRRQALLAANRPYASLTRIIHRGLTEGLAGVA